MSPYESAERLLKALKMDENDPRNNDLALQALELYGGIEPFLDEWIKPLHNPLRFTPEVLLHALIAHRVDRDHELKNLADRLYALYHTLACAPESIEQHLQRVNVTASLHLTPYEAQLLAAAGGKEFIVRMHHMRDSDQVIARLRDVANTLSSDALSHGSTLL